MATTMSLADLPEDVLTIIFSFTQPKDFLATCRTCKTLYVYRQDAVYWRILTSNTFRLPVSPLLKADGARWYYLYKRLKTHTKLYTWGQGLNGNLGPGRSPLLRLPRGRILRTGIGRVQRPGTFQRASSQWPTDTHVPDEIQVIADLQCGGWSTTILSSAGSLYVTGIVDALDGRFVGESSEQFKKLEYLTQSTSAIRQFSSGRRHILALTDDGEILSWDRINAKGLKVFSRQGQNFGGVPSRVVAGWGLSSAYVPEVGIVCWEPLENDTQDDMLDGMHVEEFVIPQTARKRSVDNQLLDVSAHVVLDDFVVWITSDSKLWACNIQSDQTNQGQVNAWPFEVPGYGSSAQSLQDIQGQFCKFAVFTQGGEVLAGDSTYLHTCARTARSHPSADDPSIAASPSTWADLDAVLQTKPTDTPALQHNHVIKLAFGDHHYHALHANGKITSYGNDPQSVGALGIGQVEDGGRFRGLRRPGPGFRGDASLIPQAEARGRNIWFEPEKRDWLRWLEDRLSAGWPGSDVQNNEGVSTGPMFHWRFDIDKQLMFSEWVEQEGTHWDDGPVGINVQNNTSATAADSHDDFHLDPYFAIAIAAAGWHSGALVLVDEDKAHETRQKWLTTVPSQSHEDGDQNGKEARYMPGHFETGPADPEETYVWKLHGFPKIVLPDGFEMPGEGEPRPWRDTKPTLSELGIDNE